MAYPNYLAFPLDSDRVSYYSTDDNAIYAKLFDPATNRMIIPIYPGEYTPTIRALGDTAVVEGLQQNVVPTPVTRPGATVDIEQGMIVIKAVLNELRDNAIAAKSYIIMHDGCDVEFQDRKQDYTVRQCWLEMPVVPKSPQARRTIGAEIDERMYAGFLLDFKFFD